MKRCREQLEALLRLAEKHRACSRGSFIAKLLIKRLTKRGHTIAEWVDRYPYYAWWFAVNVPGIPDDIADELQALGCGRAWWDDDELYHRDAGPAVIEADSSQWWYQHNRLDRKDGPAVIFADGRKEWWEDGILIRREDPKEEQKQ